MIRLLRRWHTYLGVFFAPLLLFFVLTGWLQTAYPNRSKNSSDAISLIQKARVLHTEDVYPVSGDRTRIIKPIYFKYLVYAMAIGLATTIMIGVYLAFRSVRNKWVVVASLALGILVPVLALWLGHVTATVKPPRAPPVEASAQ